jgi:hypothetical protein
MKRIEEMKETAEMLEQ